MRILPVAIVFLILFASHIPGCVTRPARQSSGSVETMTTIPLATPQPNASEPLQTIPPTPSAPLPSPPDSGLVPVATPAPEPDPTDVAAITFSEYIDDDFRVEYPSTWTIEILNSAPFPVGPFNSGEDPYVSTPPRVVTISSPDSTKKFVAMTQDFRRAGSVTLPQTIGLYRSLFERDYPGLPATVYLGNYKYFAIGTAMASRYDVILPAGTRFYPSAYTIESVITLRHEYDFGFFTDTDTFNRYGNLKDKMLGSVKIPETESHSIFIVGSQATVI